MSEGLQTILRKHKVPNSYEILHQLSRGHNLTQTILDEFIETMPSYIQEDLRKVTLETYIGLKE